jgi:hypothetical protein
VGASITLRRQGGRGDGATGATPHSEQRVGIDGQCDCLREADTRVRASRCAGNEAEATERLARARAVGDRDKSFDCAALPGWIPTHV